MLRLGFALGSYHYSKQKGKRNNYQNNHSFKIISNDQQEQINRDNSLKCGLNKMKRTKQEHQTFRNIDKTAGFTACSSTK